MLKKGIIIVSVVAVLVIALAINFYPESEEDKTIEQNYVELHLNDDIGGAPSSPMDLQLHISPFTEDYVGLITLELGPREGYVMNSDETWDDVITSINIPGGIQLISGDAEWVTDISGASKKYVISIKVLEEGEHKITFESKKENKAGYFGDLEELYIFLNNGELQVSNFPIIQDAQDNGNTSAIQICPPEKSYNLLTQECVDEVFNSDPQECPTDKLWDETQNKCIYAPNSDI